MKPVITFSFEPFCEIDAEYINLSNPKLLNKSTITPIVGNISLQDTMDLYYKNNLQHKIVDHQYNKLDQLCDELYNNSDHKRVSKNELKLLNRLNYSDCNTIKKYGNLDLLYLFQNYKKDHLLNTPQYKNNERMYCRKLLLDTGIQRRILHAQQDQILTISKVILNKEISKQDYAIINNTKFNVIIDGKLRRVADIIDQIQSKQQESPQIPISDNYKKNSDMKIISLEQFLKDNNVDVDAVKNKLEKEDQAISNDCCICFENIEQRMGLIPCGHTTICETCILNAHDNKCPLCRTIFTEHVKLFL